MHVSTTTTSAVPANASRGYALIAALLLIVAVSLATTAAVQHYGVAGQREREFDLLFVGEQFRGALISYHGFRTASGAQEYPRTLEDLLEDHRTPVPVRHLRKVYADPVTGKADWIVEKSQDRIIGVRSRSTREPLLHTGFPAGMEGFAAARTYQGWIFAPAEMIAFITAGASSVLASQHDPAPGNVGNPAPVDPNGAAALQCIQQYAIPARQCSEAVPCSIPYRTLYIQCMQAIGSAQP